MRSIQKLQSLVTRILKLNKRLAGLVLSSTEEEKRRRGISPRFIQRVQFYSPLMRRAQRTVFSLTTLKRAKNTDN